MKNKQEKNIESMILRAAIRRGIAIRGFDVIHVLADKEHPCYTYTVGLSRIYLHPELVVTGFQSKKANDIMIAFVEEVKSGRILSPGMIIADIFNRPIAIVEVPQLWIRKNMHPAEMVSRRPIRALQLVVSGPDNKYPWDREGQEDGYDQEVLGTLPPGGHATVPQGNA